MHDGRPRPLSSGRPRVRLRASGRLLAGIALLAGVASLSVLPVVRAQSDRRNPAATALALAERALVEGRLDEVATLTDKLDPQDPGVVAARARVHIARGRYQEAEAALRPAVERAPTSDAALQFGLLGQLLGRPGWNEVLAKVAETAEVAKTGPDLARSGRALRALGRFQEANAVYREAVAAQPQNPALNTGWGELFLEKHNKREALKSFQAALKEDAKWVPAMMGAAKALADDNPPQAGNFIKRVLGVNPNDVDALVFQASQAVDTGRRPDARKTLEKALAVNPSSFEARSLLAALAYVEDKADEFKAEVDTVLAVAPKYGEVFRVAGDLAARNYRFDEAVTLTRLALELDPTSARAMADLGIHLLRTGDEPAARTALEGSFKIDPFDVVTYNLLSMMDTLDGFVTMRDGDIVIRLHKDEAPVLGDFAMATAKKALATMSKRYDFTPRGPILIEIFPKHDDFAVRNVGLPGMIGALGACFGRVVTLDSPKARPPGEFQWEATLWHELAHVITVQMSNQRVPRFLTEGLSVYEETLARPEWGRGMDVRFARLLNSNQVVKLKDLNAAFQNPQTVNTAYYQASLLVQYIVDTYGEVGVHKLLRAFGRGLDTDAALKDALNTDFDQMQVGFDAALERQFGSVRRALEGPKEKVEPQKMSLDELIAYSGQHQDSYPVQLYLGTMLRKEKRPDEAMAAFERASALVPKAVGQDSPHQQMLAVALEKKDRARAITELQAILAIDFDNVSSARQLVQLLKDEGMSDAKRLQPALQRLTALDPFDGVAQASLGRLALDGGDTETAIRHFRSVVALKPVDQASAYTDLAESYLKGGRVADARRQTLAALEVAPSYERAQALLLRIAEARP